jgi:molybdenum cofactor biosynthesis protein B
MHHVDKRSVQCLVVTISDTRTVENDKSGKLINRLLDEQGHQSIKHIIVPDEKAAIIEVLREGMADERIETILMTGGTGISKRDITIEVVEKMILKEIPGFGELFRMLSYTEDIGSTAIMSRATAGVLEEDTLVFAMPGSSGAVKLAMMKLILPELSHMRHELEKHLKQ